MLTDAQHFLNLVSSYLSRHFAIDAVIFSGELILTTGLQMNKDEVVYLYYAF